MNTTHGPDLALIRAGVPGAAIVAGPCEAHGHTVIRYCEVITQDLQPTHVTVYELLVSMN